MKERFPIFKNKDLVYLDNGATTQKPLGVIESLNKFWTETNANVHRGLYTLSERSTGLYEESRSKVAKFIGAKSEEIIFTSGTTDSINGLAQSLQISNFFDHAPTILVTELEHHANLLPWQRFDKANLIYAKLDRSTFQINFDESIKPDIVAITHASNVTGTVNDIKRVRELYPDAILVIDAAQSVSHFPIDVVDLDVDFLAFSGHKLFGPTGIGVLYGKRELLEKLEPFRVGGGMIREVFRDYATWDSIPAKFEAGTPAIAEAIALGVAIDFVQEVGFEKIINEERLLKDYALEVLSNINSLEIYHAKGQSNAAPVISFSVKGVHPHDIAQYLGDRNICVRAGHHCTQILHREVLDIPASIRVSLSLYNEKSDIDTLAKALSEAIELFKKG